MDLVTLKAKPVVVVLVTVAILYVFISPLPEMAATNCGRSLILMLPSLFFFLFLAAPNLFVSLMAGRQLVTGQGLNRSLLCSRLC